MLPKGIICLWYGSIVSIPSGWALCNGTGGTPDLRDRFLVGAGNSYAVNSTGGNITHNHSFTSDGHSHTLDVGAFIQSGTGRNFMTSTESDTGNTDSKNHLPPFFALCYIMRT